MTKIIVKYKINRNNLKVIALLGEVQTLLLDAEPCDVFLLFVFFFHKANIQKLSIARILIVSLSIGTLSIA